MDIRMPEVDGINAISLIRKEYEALKIIVLTMYDDQEMITKMMEMGANAYLPKQRTLTRSTRRYSPA
jgi:DNA-binding NarL/FixJ family response regulator